MCVAPSSFIIPGLNDQGAFRTLPGDGGVAVMQKPAVGWHIFCPRAETGRRWKLLTHLRGGTRARLRHKS